MGELIRAVEGTEDGARLALGLALLAALLHAAFGALQKGRHDPWLSRGVIDLCLVALSAPVALLLVPPPRGAEWGWLAGAVVIHLGYKVLQAMSYQRAAFTVVYPVVRGTGPLFTVAAASLAFGEGYGAVQWAGVLLLTAALFALAAYNMRHVTAGRDTLVPALWLALATGLFVALYTTWDAAGIRATPKPFTFLAWFFFLSSVDFALLGLLRRRRMAAPPAWGPLLWRGLVGALVAWGSFGSVMLATRLDSVGEAAVLRETSVVFAALIGRLVLGDALGPARMALMALIAAGAVLVEAGG